jgi:hypothetical protein
MLQSHCNLFQFKSQICSRYDCLIAYEAPASSSDAGVSGSSSLYMFSAICQTCNSMMTLYYNSSTKLNKTWTVINGHWIFYLFPQKKYYDGVWLGEKTVFSGISCILFLGVWWYYLISFGNYVWYNYIKVALLNPLWIYKSKYTSFKHVKITELKADELNKYKQKVSKRYDTNQCVNSGNQMEGKSTYQHGSANYSYPSNHNSSHLTLLQKLSLWMSDS